jgi:hypothetical protein
MADSEMVHEAFASLLQATTQFSKALKENSTKAKEKSRKEFLARVQESKGAHQTSKCTIKIYLGFLGLNLSIHRADKTETLLGDVIKVHEQECSEAVKAATPACSAATGAFKSFEKATATYEHEVSSAVDAFKRVCVTAMRDVDQDVAKAIVTGIEERSDRMLKEHENSCKARLQVIKDEHERKVVQFIEQLRPVYQSIMEEVTSGE